MPEAPVISKYTFDIHTSYEGEWPETHREIAYEYNEKDARKQLKLKLGELRLTGHVIEKIDLVEKEVRL